MRKGAIFHDVLETIYLVAIDIPYEGTELDNLDCWVFLDKVKAHAYLELKKKEDTNWWACGRIFELSVYE